MKSKFIKKLILGLAIVLITLTSFTIGNYKSIKNQRNTIPITQTTKDEIKTISKEMIIKQLNNENKMLVLSGDTGVTIKYSNKNVSDDDVGFRWIKDWIAEQSSKDLSVEATYTYQFHYDLEDLNIEVVNNMPVINLSRNRLSCNVSLVENESMYADRVGIFESQFTPSEVNSINARTKELVLNRIQSDSKLRDKAMENIQANIEDLLDMKCLFNVSKYDVVQNNPVDLTINN